jgi:probable LLM family oxidoreductase
MELGVYTFGDTALDPETGKRLDTGTRLRNLVEEAELADQIGLDVFGVGEHHRADMSVATPAIMLAAIAQRTRNIRLTSAVTVLSSDDPVRVFQEFATIDHLSNGRAEIMAGRGSFTESYPLFGYDLGDYDRLFADKLDLLLKLREGGPITWDGAGRAPLDGQLVYPRPQQEPLPLWIAVGGNPNSVARAARLGLPLAIAIIGGAPDRFAPLVDLYREAGVIAGQDPEKLKVNISSIGFVGETSQAAAESFFPSYAALMTQLGRERGWSPMTRNAFEALRSPKGALFVGSPDEIVEKVLYEYELFRHDRFLLQMSIGSVPHRDVMKAIELLGTKVAPAVLKALGKKAPEAVAAG